MTVWAVIVAAGQGARSGCAKQFAHIAGHTVLWHAVRPFLQAVDVENVRVIVAPDAVQHAAKALAEFAERVEILPVGGALRTDSVRGGLAGIADDDWVLVHDAARPCLSDETLARVLAARTHSVGGLLALPLRDALKQTAAESDVAQNTVLDTAQDIAQNHPSIITLSKRGKFLAQTPQMFRAGMLRKAMDKRDLSCKTEVDIESAAADDEAQLMEQAGYTPLLIEGDVMNIKITDAADFALAEAILTMQQKQQAQQDACSSNQTVAVT